MTYGILRQIERNKELPCFRILSSWDGFPSLEKTDVQEFHDLKVLCEPKNDEDSNNVVERPQLNANTLKKGLQMVDDLVDNFFEVNLFMDMCLKFKHSMESVMTP
jgi:hypothetical protein